MLNGINNLANVESQMSEPLTQRPSRPERPPKSDNAFKQLSLDAGGDGTSISKNQLESLIDKAQKNGQNTEDLEDLLSNFDKISNGSETISSQNFSNALENGTLSNTTSENYIFSKLYNFQDPSEIILEQLEPPIDLKV